jgi:FkbM family methyltransferase
MSSNSNLESYQKYLQKYFPELNLSELPLFQAAQTTDWENPTTSIELNNFAVINIIEAENTEDTSLRQFYLELAIEALETALNQENNPLCVAHLGIIKSLMGEINLTHQMEYSQLLNLLPIIYESQLNQLAGLVYLPIKNRNKTKNKENLEKIIKLNNGYLQGFYLLMLDCEQSHKVFYNSSGLKLLNLANQIIPNSANIKLNLGISTIFNRQPEGLLYLHQARQLQPQNSKIIQALYLAYRDLNNKNLANSYYQYCNNYSQQNSENINWKWANLPLENPYTYIIFEEELLMAVEASFHSIVTSVLLAEEDWFEGEMEMWRDEIKPDMIVIDVGANVGVYTFSAAQRVGKNGTVLAVEPFSGCVECLEETRRINNLDWVKICAGAAGDSNKTVKLSLHQASELNEIIKDDASIQGQYQEVQCFTLDSLVEKYNLSTVDWLKIDAEGNEIEVLRGSNRILSEFKPHILYQNIASNNVSNISVARFLQSMGYELFYYQSFVKQFIPLQTLDDLSGKLNIIAKYSKQNLNREKNNTSQNIALSNHETKIQLHIGGKEPHPDWRILDIEQRPEVDYVMDASKLNLFEDNSVDTIYASHVLEHFYYNINNELTNTLREWYRVLKVGGKLLISVPDLKTLCQLYSQPNLTPDLRFHLMRIIFGGQTNIYDIHKVGFDIDILGMYLKSVGFKQWEQVSEFGLFNDCSQIKILNRFISLNVIATKN